MTERNWTPLSDEELDAQIDAARARYREMEHDPMHPVDAYYDRENNRIVVELRNGCVFGFPPELGQGLRGASVGELAEVEVMPLGGLHWETLDADLLVSQLLRGIFGSKRWMAELGRAGGQVKSEAKARAARENGKKGGRPRKTG